MINDKVVVLQEALQMAKGYNRQDRALRLMRKIAIRMAREIGRPVDNHEVEVLLEIRNAYQNSVGTMDDLIRRFDLVSIIA